MKVKIENQILSENNKIKFHNDRFTEETFKRILWFFFNISNSQHTMVSLLQNDVHELLLSILTVQDNKTNKLIWKIIANFLSSDDLKTQKLIKAGITEFIYSYLLRDFSTFDFSILKEVTFASSSIASGTITQIKLLISIGIIKRMWELVKIFFECDFNDPKQISNNKTDAIKV